MARAEAEVFRGDGMGHDCSTSGERSYTLRLFPTERGDRRHMGLVTQLPAMLPSHATRGRARRMLGFPKVNVELAGMAKPEPSPRRVRLLCEEYISLFQLSHNVGVPMDSLMTNAFAFDHLNHANEVGCQAVEGDDCVPRSHIALEPVRYHSTLHIH